MEGKRLRSKKETKDIQLFCLHLFASVVKESFFITFSFSSKQV